MRICDRMCNRIFCQNPHIAYFSAYNSIFRIAYAQIMPHMQKFAYMLHISAYAIAFFSIFLVQRCFKTAKYFGSKRLPVFAIRRWINWSKNVKTVQKRPISDHDYDTPSLEFAYAGNMGKNLLHICGICTTFRQIAHIFPHILPPKVPHILREFSAINQHPYSVGNPWQSYRASPAIWNHTVLAAIHTGECTLRYPQLNRTILDLPTPNGWKAELTSVVGYWFTCSLTVTHWSSNQFIVIRLGVKHTSSPS